MKKTSYADMRCSVARTLEEVGSWWSLLIIRDAMMGARRFKHFERSLGIVKNTLSSRLAQLVNVGILERVPAANGSGHDEYLLTERGKDLAPVMMSLAQWGDRWVKHPKGPSTQIVDRESGVSLPPLWPSDEAGTRLPLDRIALRRAADAPRLAWEDD